MRVLPFQGYADVYLLDVRIPAGAIAPLVSAAAILALAACFLVLGVRFLRQEVRRRTDEARRERSFLQEIIDRDPNLIYVRRWDGTYRCANQGLADMLLVTRDEMLAGNDAGFQFGKTGPTGQLTLDREVMRSGRSLTLPPALLTDPRTGRDRWFLVRKVPVGPRDEKTGRHGLALTIANDVTELHELQARLEAKVEERTQSLAMLNADLQAFVARAGHDLRSPMLAHRILLERLRRCDVPAPVHDTLDKMDDVLNEQLRFIQALTALGRSSGKDLHRRIVDVSALSETILSRLMEKEERQVALEVEPHLEVFGDPDLTRLLLENLLGNAWKYTSEARPARIRVGAHPQGVAAGIFVEDNGIGLPEQDVERIWKPFERLPSAAQFEGSGVGLATVKRITHRHGGDAWAEPLERGARFWFTMGPRNVETGPPIAIDAVGTFNATHLAQA